MLDVSFVKETRGSRGWYATTVKQRKQGKLLVHYDGWGSQWDEWIGAGDSPRLVKCAADSDWRLLFRATRDG